MARVHHVKRTRDERKCSTCDKTIEKGQPYKHASPGYRGRKIIKCEECPFKQSELTSGKESAAYAAQEVAEVALADWKGEDLEELDGIRNDFVSELESCRDEFQDSLDNMPEGLQEGPTGQEIQDKIDGLEGWIEAATDVELDADDGEEFDESELDYANDMEGSESKDSFIERMKEAWDEEHGIDLEPKREALDEAINACPF